MIDRYPTAVELIDLATNVLRAASALLGHESLSGVAADAMEKLATIPEPTCKQDEFLSMVARAEKRNPTC